MSLKSWYKKGGTEKNAPIESSVVAEPPKKKETALVHVGSLEQPLNAIPMIPSKPDQGAGNNANVSTHNQGVSGLDTLSARRAVRGAYSNPSTDHVSHIVRPTTPVYKSLPRGIQPARGPRVRFFDPLSLVYATGFRDRRYSLTYDILRRTSYQLSLIGAIIKLRSDQVASFAQPHRENRQIGFAIRFKDETRIPTEDERRVIQRIEQFIMECGWGRNPYSPFPRDNFWTFLKKVVRDSMTYDQLSFEIVPDSEGRPFEFRAVDSSTIRLAATYDGYRGEKSRTFQAKEFSEKWSAEYGDDFEFDGQGVYSVQVLHGRIENIFTHGDMAFGIRNPRSDVWTNQYGFSEIEMCLNTVMRTLWAEEYNARNFQQGSMANGILNFKGDNFAPEQIEAFKRTWAAQVSGVENSHKVPIVQIPEGVEFVNMGRGNKEMEYKSWLEYLIKIISGMYGVDPAEINFDLVSGGGGGKAPMFENKHEWKIKFSKDKGLRPLLKFIAEVISTNIVDPLDSRFYFDFVGFDQLNEQDRIDLLTKRAGSYITINEARREEGLDPIPGGDIINNPTFFQSYQSAVSDSLQQSEKSPLSPWRTAGDMPELEYGQAPPVPLYLQKGDELLDNDAGGGEGGEGEDPMGGMGGMGGMPPMG